MESKYKTATRYLFLNMAITVLERDLQYIKMSPLKIKRPYIESIEQMMSRAIEERRGLKKVMHQEKISIQMMNKSGLFTSYRFYLNGKVKNTSFFNSVIKNNVEEIIRELMQKY